MKGFINVIKPSGISSAACVGAVKRIFNVPCGHMGTLDPMAAGVLPIGLYKTSRMFDYLLDKTKIYETVFRFGVATDTLDVTGNVVETVAIIPDEETVKREIKRFIGEIEQVPPKYSAKCIDGKRGYQLARKGVDFELPPKKVVIDDIEYLGRKNATDFALRIKCRGGTYIRSLARDLGVACGSAAVMVSLDRRACGVFDYGNGVALDELKAATDPYQYVLPADCAVDFPKIELTADKMKKILDGVFDNYGYADGVYRVYCLNEFRGIGVANGGVLKIKAYV